MRHVGALALVLALTIALPDAIHAQQTEEPPRLPPVVVTPSCIERRVGETPASVTVISGETVRNAPQQTVDDLLRQVPSFSLFRRSSSLVTHPTAQGVSLRGIGPSGASRALVLLDGVPINGPFGGWVQWSRLPLLGIEQIEVMRGGGGALWGNGALGGVIHVISRRPSERRLTFEASYGSLDTKRFDLFATEVQDPVRGSVEGTKFDTAGYDVVRRSRRGRIDQTADSHNTFSTQANDRNSETLALDQRSPSTTAGGVVQWSRSFGDHVLLAGLDTHWVTGKTDENVFTAGRYTRTRVAGGDQIFLGAFVQDAWKVTPWLELTGGLRGDWWQAYDGVRTDDPPPAGIPPRQKFSDSSYFIPSPRLAAIVHATAATDVFASAYQGFRVPTLNELYRPFRVRNDVTVANERLKPERLTGGEAGVDQRWGVVDVRVTGFWNEVQDQILNVTLSTLFPDCPAGTTCRQRRNVDLTRIRGVETEIEVRPFRHWRLIAGHVYLDARVVSAPGQVALQGNRLAQVPDHVFTAGVRWEDPAWFAATLLVRRVGSQFGDDLNTLPMGAYTTLDVRLSRRLSRWADVYVAVENLLDETYAVARTSERRRLRRRAARRSRRRPPPVLARTSLLTPRGLGRIFRRAGACPADQCRNQSSRGRFAMRYASSRLAVALAIALILAPVALAQQPQPPPTWKQGQPPEMANSPLAPVAQPPAPKAPGEILVNKIKVPQGFKVELWAHGINNARVMTWGEKGTLFVSSRVAGNVYAIVEQGGQRVVKTIAKGLNLPNGVAFKDGTLYVAEIHRITKMEGIEGKLDSPPEMKVVYETLPKDVPHGWKYLAFGPDGKLYFNIGAPCNICIPPDTHANISRINPDGTGFEYWAHGVRNSVGFDWHPVTKELYFTTHARDWLGEDVPSDRFDVAPKKGLHFGYPYCHQGDIPDPQFHSGRSCSEFAPPLIKTGPHVAGNGVMFYTGSMFPPEYKNRIFLAQRGAWNRTQKTGYRVMMVTLRTGDVPKYEVFAEGWLENNQPWGRPNYLTHMKDGSILLSDDYAGAIYRISYSR